MKILFDNGTPKPIARSLTSHEVSYAQQIGWHELESGELIQRAEDAGYEVLLCTDKNIRYQQNFEGLSMPSCVKNPWVVPLFCLAFMLWTGLWPGIKAQGQTRAAAADNPSHSIQEMQAVEDRWSNAVTQRDQYGLELVLAPQFIGVSSTGDVSTRDQQIAHLFVRDEEPASLEQKVISARFIGDLAIVNGTYVKHWKLEKGVVEEKGIYSHVFMHGRAGWLCLNSQQTVVAEKEPESAATSKTKSKSSNASLPLHIPLIYKGPSSTQPPPAPGANKPPS